MKRTLIAVARVVAGLCIQLGGMYLALLVSFDLDGSGPDWLGLAALALLGLAAVVAGWVAGRYLMVPALALFVLVWAELSDYDQWRYLTPAEVLAQDGSGLFALVLCCAVLAACIALGYRGARRIWPGARAPAPRRDEAGPG